LDEASPNESRLRYYVTLKKKKAGREKKERSKEEKIRRAIPEISSGQFAGKIFRHVNS